MRKFISMLLLFSLVALFAFQASADDDTVYIATLSGTKFHVDRDCWGLEKALMVSEVDMDMAYEHGYTPCKVCAYYLASESDAKVKKPSSADGVLLESDVAYAAANGRLYHDKADCVNLWYTDDIVSDRLVYFLDDYLSHCPLCVLDYPVDDMYTDSVVFTSMLDKYFHSSPNCSEIVNTKKSPIYEINETNLPLNREECPACYPDKK